MVQRREVGMVSNLRGKNYEARLEEVGMISLADRRMRGDMITTYKIMTGKDRIDPGEFFELAAEGPGRRTRRAAGVHNIRAVSARLDIRRYSFSHRVVNTSQTLSQTVSRGWGLFLGSR